MMIDDDDDTGLRMCQFYFADHSDIELSVEIFGLFIHFSNSCIHFSALRFSWQLQNYLLCM